MSENASETDPRRSAPTSKGMLLVEGLALTLLLVSLLKRLFSFLNVLTLPGGPDSSHYLPPDVTTRGEVGGGSVTRGQTGYVTIKPKVPLTKTMSISVQISYQYSDDNGFHSAPLTSFLFLGTQPNPPITVPFPTAGVNPTDSIWQTLTVIVYSEVFDNKVLQKTFTDPEPVNLQ